MARFRSSAFLLLATLTLSGCASIKLVNGRTPGYVTELTSTVEAEGISVQGIPFTHKEATVDLSHLCAPNETWTHIRVREHPISAMPFIGRPTKGIDYACRPLSARKKAK